ncbi:EF-hand calcium-binding domain-containing protein 1 [Halocaridina rubra]|uniref:EF-hand calcium-binding domain-containing protein 1 n=1 Tax=Halocaridina rubra TaxID=373956 RepID=A0AAN9AEZ8_HALRR
MSKNTTYKGYSKQAEKIARNTHFTCEEVDALLNLHDPSGSSPRMDGNRFRDIMHGIFGMTDEGLMECMYQVFDMDQDGAIGPEEFVVGMSVFLRGTLEEKIDYCFSVYDHNGDGLVSRDEMFHHLKSAVVNIPPGEELDEVVKDMVVVIHVSAYISPATLKQKCQQHLPKNVVSTQICLNNTQHVYIFTDTLYISHYLSATLQHFLILPFF